MTREYAIRTKTWVTNEGRYLDIDEIADDHLCAIRAMLLNDLPSGYDLTRGREAAADWVARYKDDYTIELDREAYAAAWIQIIDDEVVRRTGSAAPN